MLPSSRNVQHAPPVGVPQHLPVAGSSRLAAETPMQDTPTKRDLPRKRSFHRTRRTSTSMRLPGCHELLNGVPAPDSLWARAGDGSPSGGKVPLLDGFMQPTRSSVGSSQPRTLSVPDIHPVARPDDAPPPFRTPPVDNPPAEASPALLFSSLPSSRPSFTTGPTLDQQPAGSLMPYKHKNIARYSPYASSIGSSWSPPSSASSFLSLANATSSRVAGARLESPGFFASPPPFTPSPPHHARDLINHNPTTPPLGRLRPVDPSWCAESEHQGPSLRHASTNSASTSSTQREDDDMSDEDEGIVVPRKRKRAPGRGKPEGEAHTTALDNAPPPFNLDQASYTILKDHLWIRDGVMPPSFHCLWRGCHLRVSTGESQIPTHYTDVHNLAPGSTRVRCRWVDNKGKMCTAHTSFHNYRLHVLDVHLRVNIGRCKICNHLMTNDGGMKRHLKRCLRMRTVDEMWQQYGVHIVLPPPGVEGAEGRCYIPP
ncbi:unnamed protein product [Peniophora sp. CBMAI 1063]|nr:unnamed protein product [Peniophora sp. CBMAI 1063]